VRNRILGTRPSSFSQSNGQVKVRFAINIKGNFQRLKGVRRWSTYP